MTHSPQLSLGCHALVFVDIDGVLHRRDGRWFERLPILAAWLYTHPEVDIVLSSSHREHAGLDRLRSALPESLRPRLVGQTPRLGQGRWDPPVPFVRQREVEAYLCELAGPAMPFAVLDDDASLFSPGWPPLACTYARQGLTEDVLGLVERILKDQTTSG